MSHAHEAPDLQAWVERYGGYWNIPWGEWDRQMASYLDKMRFGDFAREDHAAEFKQRQLECVAWPQCGCVWSIRTCRGMS